MIEGRKRFRVMTLWGYSFFIYYWFMWSLKSTCSFLLGPFWRFKNRRKKEKDLKKWEWDKISVSEAKNWILLCCKSKEVAIAENCTRVFRAQNNAHVTGKMAINNQINVKVSCFLWKSTNQETQKSEFVFSFFFFWLKRKKEKKGVIGVCPIWLQKVLLVSMLLIEIYC